MESLTSITPEPGSTRTPSHSKAVLSRRTSEAFARYSEYIRDSGTTLWGRVVSIIALAGSVGITDSEGASRLDMTRSTYARRRRELRQMGLVEDSGKQRYNRETHGFENIWVMK